jgi:hypothetical protein
MVDVAEKIRTALEKLTAREGWQMFTVAQIAREASLGTGAVSARLFPQPGANQDGIDGVIPGMNDNGTRGASLQHDY